MIKGQEKVINTIDKLNKLPHSILLVGEFGSGHIDICNYMANKFNLVSYDMTEFINHEFIEEVYSVSTPSLYYIDMSKVDERGQNIILKLFEEPSPYCYIVLNCESEDLVIDTIKSRSYILRLERYKRDDLYELIIDKELADVILSICTTPGQIEVANHTDINSLLTLCTKMLVSISTANFQNTLSISNKINFKDNYDKFDLMLFFNVLKKRLRNSENLDFDHKLEIYSIIDEYSKYIRYMNNKQTYFENMLIKLWCLTHDISLIDTK